MGYTEKAYQLYSDWLVGNEDVYDWCYADMGYILMTKGDWENSIDLLEKADKINNADFYTKKYLSFYYFFREDFLEAGNYEYQFRYRKNTYEEIKWKESQNEFLEGYKNDWQFQKLLQVTLG